MSHSLAQSICEITLILTMFISVTIFSFIKIDKLYNLNKKANNLSPIKYKKEKRFLKFIIGAISFINISSIILITTFEYEVLLPFTIFNILLLIFMYFEKNTIKDIINGYYILVDDKFRVGDNVKVNNTVGEVIRIGFRNVILLDREEKIICLQNSNIRDIEINSINKEVAIYEFLIDYDSNIEKAEILLKLLTKEVEKNVHDIEGKVNYIILDDIICRGILYRFKAPVKKGSKYIVQCEMRKIIKSTFKKENIELTEVINNGK